MTTPTWLGAGGRRERDQVEQSLSHAGHGVVGGHSVSLGSPVSSPTDLLVPWPSGRGGERWFIPQRANLLSSSLLAP